MHALRRRRNQSLRRRNWGVDAEAPDMRANFCFFIFLANLLLGAARDLRFGYRVGRIVPYWVGSRARCGLEFVYGL